MSENLPQKTYSGVVADRVKAFTEDEIRAVINAGIIPREAAANKANIDLYFFTCKEIGANPFTGQASLVPMRGQFRVMVDYKFLRAKCAQHKDWGGQSKITYNGGKTVFEMADQVPKTAEVTVYRYYNGERIGEEVQVSWKEYKGVGPLWNSKPLWMLGKVVMKKACEIAFPECCEGLYIPEEFQSPPTIVTDTSGQQIETEQGAEHWYALEAATTGSEITEIMTEAAPVLNNNPEWIQATKAKREAIEREERGGGE